MSIKKSQAILKCFIDLKNSVWFTLHGLRRRNHAWFVTLETFFSSTATGLLVTVLKRLNDRQSYILLKFHKIENIVPANIDYHVSIKKSQAILKCFVDLKNSVWFTLHGLRRRNHVLNCDTYFFQLDCRLRF